VRLSRLVEEAERRNRDELVNIGRELGQARRCAVLAVKQMAQGDLEGARAWLDRACDHEGDALGDCEGYGWARQALGDECPWRILRYFTSACASRLVLQSTCKDGTCRLEPGDTVRSDAGSGTVVDVNVAETELRDTLLGQVLDGMAALEQGHTVATWEGELPDNCLVWKWDAKLGTAPKSRTPDPEL
jgi:hypothetical protein